MASRKGSSAEAMEAAAADQPRDVADYFNPVHEWLSEDGHYTLRLNLPGFTKEDLRVQVDTAGRLTIRGQRPADGGAGSVWLHKEFLLPPTSDLDGITGRFEGGVLTITVPKLPPGAVAPPQATEEEEKEEEDVADKPTDQKAKVDSEAEQRIEAARAALAAGRHREEEEEKQTGRSKKPPAKKVDEVGEEPKAVATATPSEKAAKREDEDDKARAEHRAKVGREAERRIEAARERLAEAEREREKGRWKERAAEEGFKWSEAIGKKKEVIAAVAAVTLGVFVLHKLFSKN